MKKRIALAVILMVGLVEAATMKTIYKVTKLSPTVVGISCPLNGGDPAVVRNVDGVLLVSCGTYDPSVLAPK